MRNIYRCNFNPRLVFAFVDMIFCDIMSIFNLGRNDLLHFAGCNQPMVNSILNGFVTISQPTFPTGSMLTYSCSSDFSISSPFVTECQAGTFTWSLDNAAPSCRRSNVLQSAYALNLIECKILFTS